jgi:hypothetical protein
MSQKMVNQSEGKSSLELATDIEQVERAEKELNGFIERRATAREEANAEAFEERRRDRRRLEKLRQENAEAWVDFFMCQAETHALISAENERKARELLNTNGKES